MSALKKIREDKGVTKAARPTYDVYEEDPRKMRCETAVRAAEFLNVDPLIFFDQEQQFISCSVLKGGAKWGKES